MSSTLPPTATLPPTGAAPTLTFADLGAPGVAATRFRPPELALPPQGPALGKGGMGEVFRAWDPVLNRSVAVKVLLDDGPQRVARFVTEAQVTAQLEHPAIVPVHALGRLPDGRLAIAMKEVHGRTLRAVLQAGDAGDPGRVRRQVALLQRAAEAIAYAHARGVVHRDLKPDNIMVGDFGEVLVLDWGLARVQGLREGGADTPTTTTSSHTVVGTVMGTRGYMSPEQATGQPVDARSDVYALGVILLEIARGDHRDWPADLLDTVSGRGLAPDQTLPALAEDQALSSELIAIAARALRADPAARHPDASAFVADLSAWLEGSRRRQRALDLVEEARTRFSRQRALLSAAAALRQEAAELLATVPSWKADPTKDRAWALEDEARDLEADADHAELEALDLLASALNHDPDLRQAHALLAAHHRDAAEAAERQGDLRTARRHEALVALHDRGDHAAWIDATGRLSLRTDPPGATVALFRYVERARRLVPEALGELGPTPIDGHRLPRGRYLCRISAKGRAPAAYPVAIGRGAHWDGVPPGGDRPHPIPLLRADALPAGTRYVPAGWFLAGDPAAFKSHLPQRIWLDGFLARDTCVTVAEYLAFLNDLEATGQGELAARVAPHERGAMGSGHKQLFGRRDDGVWFNQPDPDGDLWGERWPVLMVDWHGAMAYAAWFAARTGMPWRLPTELEAEKMSRGVDGRAWPWGDGFDPSFCHMEKSHEGRRNPIDAGTHPVDVSPYGLRDVAGNVRWWCLDAYEEDRTRPLPGGRAPDPVLPSDGGYANVRGSSWVLSAMSCRVSQRFKNRLTYVAYDLSFRLVCPHGAATLSSPD